MRISSFKTKIFFYLLVVGLCALFIMGSITAVNNRRDMHENLMQALMLTEQQTCAQIENAPVSGGGRAGDDEPCMSIGYIQPPHPPAASIWTANSNVKTVLGSLTSTLFHLQHVHLCAPILPSGLYRRELFYLGSAGTFRHDPGGAAVQPQTTPVEVQRESELCLDV